MKSPRDWSLLLFATALFVAVFFFLLVRSPEKTGSFLVPESEGAEDDPYAGFRQEFQMLRDPAINGIPRNMFRREQEFAKNLPKRNEFLFSLGKRFKNAAALTWTERGPNNIGGRTRALSIDVRTSTSPNITIIGGGVSGGMWRSTDDGTSWTIATTLPQLHSATCVAQDVRAGREDTWYAGTGELAGNSASGGMAFFAGDGIFKSSDNGVTWALLPSTSNGTPAWDGDFDIIWNLAIDPSNAAQDEVYAAVYGGIKRSTDGGSTWTGVLGDFTHGNCTDVAVTSSGVVYAAISSNSSGNGGLWRSPDGVSWTNISSGVTGFPTTFGRVVIGVAPSNENVVYVLINGANTDPKINGHQFWKYRYYSHDGSGTYGTWENRGGNLPNESGGTDPFYTQGGYDMLVRVSPGDTNFVIIGGTNLYRTTDGFGTNLNFKRVGGYTIANHHCDLHAGVFRPGSSAVFYTGEDGGIHRTSDVTATTVSWSSLNGGYNVTQFYSISLDPQSGSNILMGGTQDNGTLYTTSAGLGNWVAKGGGDGTIVEVAPLADDRLYVAYQYGGVISVKRDGSLVQTFTPPSGSSGMLNQLFVNPLVLDPNNSSLLYYAAGSKDSTTGIWRNDAVKSTTPLSSWTYLASTELLGIDQVSAIGISTASSSNVLYYGTAYGQVFRVDGANSGSNPPVTNITAGLPAAGLPSSGYVSCIAVDPTNSANVLLTFSNYNFKSIWYTTNSGSTWSDQEGNLAGSSGPSVRAATIFYVGGYLHVFLATSVGVYYTMNLNGGSTVWTQEATSSIGNVVSAFLDYRPSDNTLAVATHGRGAFTAQVSTPLPVELVSLWGEAGTDGVSLSWRTVTETNNFGFEIQRRCTAIGTTPCSEDWKKIGFVEGSGNSSSPREYSFEDGLLPPGRYAYRVKQINTDGTFSYSGTVEVELGLAPNRFTLSQNYPNPFNPTTAISYQLPAVSYVTLKVYDLLGREVATLVNEVKQAGSYSANWDASRLSSGVYFYQLEAGQFRETKRMILMK